MLWAGKQLNGTEEARLRRLVHSLRRAGNDELAEDFERFLPENEQRWSPNELEAGAHQGPWLRMDADLDDDQPPFRDTA